MRTRQLIVIPLVIALAPGCALFRSAKGDEASPRELHFEPVTIMGDLELEKLNAEELFAGGESAFAAQDFRQAARFFGRIADFHPDSIHRRAALYNSGLAHEKLKEWDEARLRFLELSDPHKGTGDSLDAAFRVAETLYHLEQFDDAVTILKVLGDRADLPMNKRVEAQVQKGICELEAGRPDAAEATLRHVAAVYQDLPDKDQVDDYYPAQAQFFMGEIYRVHFEAAQLDPEKGIDQLAKDLEYKSELLLSSQGHYLRSIRIGNGYWATASGSQIGGLYESFYADMINSPAPKELNGEEVEVYRQELRKKIRVLLTKAITIYERTLEAAERIGSSSPFVDKTREKLQKMKELLLADAKADEEESSGGTGPSTPPAPEPPVPHS
ncbi:MAG: tetratricopeptide repeat protein [Myxococcaceae bacterium]